jgi:hypothetical protein
MGLQTHDPEASHSERSKKSSGISPLTWIMSGWMSNQLRAARLYFFRMTIGFEDNL